MKTVLITILALCFSCSTKQIAEKKDKYILMDDLWREEATIDEIKKTFGDHFKEVESGIIYTFPNSNFPETGFFFDSSSKLRGQFVFMDEASLARFKKAMKCNWKETEETKLVTHYTRTYTKGSCTDLSISYETYPEMNAFEVRWKR